MRIPKGYSVYETCRRLRERALQEGRIISFRAYCSTEFERGARSTEVRSQLQASGVTIVDTPHNGSKEGGLVKSLGKGELMNLDRPPVCDKAIIVDLFTFVLDNPAPATIILVSGDADFAYACSTLRNRRFRVVIICPEERLVNQALRESCDELCADWRTAILQMPPAPPRRDAPMSRKKYVLASLSAERPCHADHPAVTLCTAHQKVSNDSITATGEHRCRRCPPYRPSQSPRAH